MKGIWVDNMADEITNAVASIFTGESDHKIQSERSSFTWLFRISLCSILFLPSLLIVLFFNPSRCVLVSTGLFDSLLSGSLFIRSSNCGQVWNDELCDELWRHRRSIEDFVTLNKKPSPTYHNFIAWNEHFHWKPTPQQNCAEKDGKECCWSSYHRTKYLWIAPWNMQGIHRDHQKSVLEEKQKLKQVRIRKI